MLDTINYYSEISIPASIWLDQLPAGYKELATYNLIHHRTHDFSCNDLATALHAFKWDDTHEGYDFWLAVWRTFSAKLPPLPDNHPVLKINNNERIIKSVTRRRKQNRRVTTTPR